MYRKSSVSDLLVEPEPVLKIGRPERARAEIQNAAVRFLWSRPFREMTVNKLMAQTSLSRAAFYYHFADIHDLMETMLGRLQIDVMAGVSPWLSEEGDPVALLYQSLSAEVELSYTRGPLLKAFSDSAGFDKRMEEAWYGFLDSFDDAVAERISADQEQGLIDPLDARLIATTLNHADAALYIRAFGSKPRRQRGQVLRAIARVWISTLYGRRWVENRASTLYREQSQEK